MPPAVDDWEVPRSRVQFLEEIGSGEYGKVHKAIVTGKLREFKVKTMVAVKVNSSEIAISDLKEFLAEADIMKRLSNPHHPNVRLIYFDRAHQINLITQSKSISGCSTTRGLHSI